MSSRQTIHVREADWPRDKTHLRRIRADVFIRELGIAEHLEWDGLDADATHLIAETNDGNAIGTVRLLPGGKIGRMAVLPGYRGQGVGTALLTALLELARQEGFAELELHAQVPAIAFYQRFGFRASGARFDEAGIPHQAMRLTVQ